MRIVASVLGGLASLVFICASAAMNWLFMRGQGRTPLEGEILGLVSIAVDAVKALLPFFIALAWAQRQWLRAVLSAGVLDLFFAFSLLSALGFVATNRGAVADHRAAVTARFELTRRALGEAEVRLAALGPTRPEGQIEAELAGLKQDRRWHFSQACTMATGPASRDFCAQIFAHEGERAQAQAAEALRERIEVLRDEMTRAQAGGAGEDRDPQAGLIARLSGLDVSEAQQALSALMAVLVEIGAAATLYLAAGPSGPGRRHPAPEAMASETPRVMTGPEEERFRLPASGRVLLSG